MNNHAQAAGNGSSAAVLAAQQPNSAQIHPQWAIEETLYLLVEAAPVAIVTVDEHGLIIFVNGKLEELFGYSRSELVGRPLELLIPERYRDVHSGHRNSYREQPYVRTMGMGMDLVARRKDGSEFPIEAGLSPVHINGSLFMMGSLTDISRRKQYEVTLEHRVEERTREIERRREVADSLRDMLAILNSNRPLNDILQHITVQASRLLGSDASAIIRIYEPRTRVAVRASHAVPVDYLSDERVLAHANMMEQAIGDERPVLVRTLPLSTATNTFPVRVLTTASDGDYQAYLAVPLTIKDNVYGGLMLYYRHDYAPTSEDIDLVVSFGDQAALAIDNARLRTQVERSAVAAERNRIARDLHDSVTQTLFSASLIAEVLPRIWERDLEESQRRLEELRQLTRGALAEMRTLLLELRPAAVIEVEISELLRQLTEAATGRARVPVGLQIKGSAEFPPDVKIALYHIAQEALNNVAKHARATSARVTLCREPDHVTLSVCDDGRGFVMEGVTPEHLGLTIMKERAEAIGARLEIKTNLGVGTEIAVDWQAPVNP